MITVPQKHALQRYRKRLRQQGLARFEVLGRATDRELIRAAARRLAEDGADSTRIRTAIRGAIAGESPAKGGILAALRRSPLVGADLEIKREKGQDRKVEL